MDKTLIHIADRPMFSVKDDGTTLEELVSIYVEPGTGKFVINLPEFCPAGEVSGTSLDDAVAAYESNCEGFSRIRLGGLKEPMIMVRVQHRPSNLNREALQLEQVVGLGVLPVYVVKREGQETVIYKRDGEHLGSPIIGNVDFCPAVLLPDTPEVHEKAQALISSMSVAASTLQAFAEAEDPLAYFKAIGDDMSPAPKQEPVQAELPLADTPSTEADPDFDEDEEL